MSRDTPALDRALGTYAVLVDHWNAIEADFARYYGMDLARACFGDDHIGVRRLHALISGLPPASALARAMGWGWDDAHEMTATLVELAHDTAVSSRGVVQALTGKRFRGPPEPLRYPRPSVPVPSTPAAPAGEPRRPLTRQDIRSILLRR